MSINISFQQSMKYKQYKWSRTLQHCADDHDGSNAGPDHSLDAC